MRKKELGFSIVLIMMLLNIGGNSQRANTLKAAHVNAVTNAAIEMVEAVTNAAVVSEGAAKLEATTSEAISADSEKKTGIQLQTKKIVIGKGERVELPIKGKRKGVSYYCKSHGVISVSDAGKIKGLRTGKTELEITKGSASAVLKVEVRKKPTKVVLSEPKVTAVKIGTKIPLKISYGKKQASYNVKWKSSNKEVATVNGKGVITVRGTGLLVVTATTYNGKKGSIKLRFQ